MSCTVEQQLIGLIKECLTAPIEISIRFPSASMFMDLGEKT